MPLYTFVLDYRGGTYVSQCDADDVRLATEAWASTLRTSEIHDLGAVGKARILGDVSSDDNRPVQLNGLSGVYCTSARTPRGMALIHIVVTATGAESP